MIMAIVKVKTMKTVRNLDVAEFRNISSIYDKQVKISTEIFFNYLLLNFQVEIDDFASFHSIRKYNYCHFSSDHKMAYFIENDELEFYKISQRGITSYNYEGSEISFKSSKDDSNSKYFDNENKDYLTKLDSKEKKPSFEETPIVTY